MSFNENEIALLSGDEDNCRRVLLFDTSKHFKEMKKTKLCWRTIFDDDPNLSDS